VTVVAAFDVDGTLTTRDCVVPFMRRVRGDVAFARRIVRRTPAIAPALVRRDRDTVKAVASWAAFAGLAIDELRREGERFADLVNERHLRPDTVARLRWHREQDHVVVLVSASFEVYLDRLATLLGAGAAIGTRLEVGRDRRCTGALTGANCRGPEKVRRLHTWLDQHHGGRAMVEIHAYGDSPGDRELLGDADHPVWVHEPSRERRR
jgi:phosphatidylglycerophosphatase C